MKHTGHDSAARYLRELERRLAALPGEQRAAILDDVRAHLEDAAELGRPIEDVIAALGPAETVAAEYLREFGVTHDDTPARRARGLLLGAAVTTGVVTAVLTAFLFPVFISETAITINGSPSVVTRDAETPAQLMGPSVVLLLLIPALFAAVPLLVSQRSRARVTLIVAVLVSLFVLIGGATVGGFFVPLVLLLWAAVLVPARLGRGSPARRGSVGRAIVVIVVALPAVLLVGGVVSGAVAIGWGVAALVAVSFLLAGLIAAGFRSAYSAVAALGGAAMIATAIDPGLLMTATWTLGGLWLVIGMVGYASTAPPRRG